MRIPGLAVAGLLAASGAQAEVVDSTANGFAVKQEAEIAAPAGKVYEAIVAIGRWWSSDHTYSGDASNMTLEARANGCFCEALDRRRIGGAHERRLCRSGQAAAAGRRPRAAPNCGRDRPHELGALRSRRQDAGDLDLRCRRLCDRRSRAVGRTGRRSARRAVRSGSGATSRREARTDAAKSLRNRNLTLIADSAGAPANAL